MRRARVGRIAVGLVQRDRENRRVLVKRHLGSIAVVRVPVHDGHTLDAKGILCMTDGNRDVAEDAAAHAHVGERVVAWRPNEGVGVVEFPLDDSVDGRDARPCGEECDLEARAVDERILAGVSAGSVAEVANEVDVRCVVDAGDLLQGGRLWTKPPHMFAESADLDEAVDATNPVRRLGVEARLHHPPGGYHRGGRPRVMPQEALVVDEPRFALRPAHEQPGDGGCVPPVGGGVPWDPVGTVTHRRLRRGAGLSCPGLS